MVSFEETVRNADAVWVDRMISPSTSKSTAPTALRQQWQQSQPTMPLSKQSTHYPSSIAISICISPTPPFALSSTRPSPAPSVMNELTYDTLKFAPSTLNSMYQKSAAGFAAGLQIFGQLHMRQTELKRWPIIASSPRASLR